MIIQQRVEAGKIEKMDLVGRWRAVIALLLTIWLILLALCVKPQRCSSRMWQEKCMLLPCMDFLEGCNGED